MSRRWAAAGLAMAAAFAFSAPARAQFLTFYNYEMSPREIVGMLADDGYRLRGPMIRRGDVYVCDVASISGRTARLIVSARDGEILERYATAPRWRDFDQDDPRLNRPRDFGDDEFGRPPRQMALGEDGGPPRAPGDTMFGPRPTPPGFVPDAESAPRVKHHAAKKRKEPAVASAPAAPAAEASPADAPKPLDAAKPADTAKPADAVKPADAGKPASGGSSVAAVAPSAPAPQPKPAAEPVKPAPVAAPRKPEAQAHAASAAEAKTDTPAPAAPAKPKPDNRKKLNDLPVDTLD